MAEQVSAPSTSAGQHGMQSDALKVIGLISGGKDSFYSLLHCMRNGHEIVALGNLFPPLPAQGEGQDEEDLNSFMYQTVGHTVIPAYEELVGKPLYRQEILGGAVQTTASYASPLEDGEGLRSEEDETESLTILLKRIMEDHPTANAVCSGAILSTYQRTRIESVALRLGLVPLAYLWQYTVVRPESQAALLMDMYEVGLDARIVKVASGGLDGRNLWMRVTEPKGIATLENKLKKFGLDGDGSVIGEGGEFETIVIGGPNSLFRGRIEVDAKDLKSVSEGGGTEWLRIDAIKTVLDPKVTSTAPSAECRVPHLLDSNFGAINSILKAWSPSSPLQERSPITTKASFLPGGPNPQIISRVFHPGQAGFDDVEEQAKDIVASIQHFIQTSRLSSRDIIASHIVLPSMNHFQTVNKWYGSLFNDPNPPARVTISCQSRPSGPQKLQIQLTFFTPPPTLSRSEQVKKALHVQSRSYWAPANIGPYSQAVAYPCIPTKSHGKNPGTDEQANDQDEESDEEDDETQFLPTWLVRIAGQIPLVPASMTLPAFHGGDWITQFKAQAVLSLQHLWRIGVAMDVKWFTGTVAYISSASSSNETLDGKLCAQVVSKTWELVHAVPETTEKTTEEDGEEDVDADFDIWHQRNNRTNDFGAKNTSASKLPDWSLLHVQKSEDSKGLHPPIFTAMIESLPRAADVEWHAFSGIGTGATKIMSQKHVSKDFTLHHLTTSSYITHTIIALHVPRRDTVSASDLTSVSSQLNDNFLQALQFLDLTHEDFLKMANLACLDTRFGSWWTTEQISVQVVGCTGIWDSEANEIAGFWVLEGVL